MAAAGGVEADAFAFADGLDGLDDADFIVDVHDGDQHRVGLERRRHRLRVEHAVPSRRKIAHAPPAPFEFAARIEDRLVLGTHRDDMPP